MDEDAEGHVTLTLLGVSQKDKGVYTVKASNSFGESKSSSELNVNKKAKVPEPAEVADEPEVCEVTEVTEVTESAEVIKEIIPELIEEKTSPPKFTKKFEDVTAKENEEVVLECAVEGNPIPDVSSFNIKILFCRKIIPLIFSTNFFVRRHLRPNFMFLKIKIN